MLANEPTWTAERVELLKSRFEAGLSCREIADDIGVSRNAVIGKLSRLNLTREERADRSPPAQKDPANGPRPRTVRTLRSRMLLTLCADSQPAADDEPIHNEHC